MRPSAVEAEFVFGVDQDQAALRGDLAAAREQRERQFRHRLPLRRGQQAARDDLAGGQRLVMPAVERLGGRRDDRRRGSFWFSRSPSGKRMPYISRRPALYIGQIEVAVVPAR